LRKETDPGEKRDKVSQRFSLALGTIEISKSVLTVSHIGGDLLKAYEEKKREEEGGGRARQKIEASSIRTAAWPATEKVKRL
jgi:hypothetical protein